MIFMMKLNEIGFRRFFVLGTGLIFVVILLMDYAHKINPYTIRELGIDKILDLARDKFVLRRQNIPNLLVTSMTLPFILACLFFATHQGALVGVGVVAHGVAFHFVGGKAWAHFAASAVAYVLVELWKLAIASKELRDWRAAIKAAEEGGEGDKGEKKRVLILYANVGSGHKSAANAIEEALKERDMGVMVEKLDVLDLCSPAFRFAMQTMFQKLTQTLAGQHMLGYLYDMGDHGNEKGKVQRALEDAAGIGLAKVLTR